MKKIKLKSASIILLCLVESASASEPLALNELLKTTLVKNQALKMYQCDVDIAKTEKSAAAGGFFPSIRFKGGYRSQSPENYASKTLALQTGSQVERDRDLFSLSCEVESVLYSGGYTLASYRLAGFEAKRKEAEYELKRREIVFKVKDAYCKLQLSQEKINDLKNAVEACEEHNKIVEAKYKAHVILKTELLFSNSELFATKQKLSQAESDRLSAISQLSKLIDTDLPEDSITAAQLNEELGEPEYESIKKEMLETHPKILIAEYDVNAALMRMEMANSEYFRPKVKLAGNYNLSENIWFPQEDDWAVGIGVEIPFFAGGSSRAQIKKGKLNKEKAGVLKNYVRKELESDFEISVFQFNNARENLSLAELRLKEAIENMNICRRGFKAGTTSNEQYLRSQQHLTQSRIDKIESVYMLKKARAEMEYYGGSN